MEMVKKNVLSVICGVVALISLLALVWPVSGMYDEQTAVLKTRQKVDTEISNMIKAPRFWPVIPDIQSGEKSPLKRFPNDEVISKGIEIKEAVKRDAETMGKEVVRDNRHEPLVRGTLPNPGDLGFQFQQTYLEMVQDGPKGPSILHQQLQGTVPPTDADVHAEADRLWNATYFPKIVTVLGQQVNYPQVAAEWQKAAEGLEPQLRLAAAHKGKMYLEPNWLSIQKQVSVLGNKPKDPEIWFAQNMLWVQQDVLDAVLRLNASARNVEDATIKHIFSLEVPDNESMYVTDPNAGAAHPAGEVPAKAYTVSFTGRVSNSLYDVVQFQLVMNVEASKIPIILTELQRNKLITILQADHTAVDGIAAAENGFIYGNVPVARLTIRGEELFMRRWTTPLMPPLIQTMLQVAPAAPGTPR